MVNDREDEMAKHRYRGRRREFPGIVIRILGEWVRIVQPPYGIQLVKRPVVR